MRVLWLTDHILPEHALALGKQPSQIGGWMPALADSLMRIGQVELGVATNVPGCSWAKEHVNDKTYFSIPIKNGKINYKDLPHALIIGYQRAVDEFKPDIIHIHGTEYFHGLLTGRKHIQCPTVISIQGIIDVCKDHYFGGIPYKDLVRSRTLRDWIRLDGVIEQNMRWHKRAKWEQEVFSRNTSFIGRTHWDRAQVRRLNPYARYYHCDEILRSPFYEKSWRIDDIIRHTIYASSASYPLKGFHVLIKSVALLKKEFPNIVVRVPSTNSYHEATGIQRIWKNMKSMGYAKYMTNIIRKERIQEHFISFGVICAETVTNELINSHVFVLPSYIENSPNSLAEAMLLGTPSIASFVGGVPSMVDDGETVLCFPSGDAVLLAEKIRCIFLDDDLAGQLSYRAKIIALKRHSRDTITSTMLDIYSKEIDIQNK